MSKAMNEFLDRLKRASAAELDEMKLEMKNAILSKCIDKGLFTMEEYKEKYENQFLDQHGFDSFINYLEAISHNCVFVTTNQAIIQRKDELEQRFKTKICSLDGLSELKE